MQQQTITIPLNCLVPSPRNVRKTGGTSIANLAASIRAHGLLQCLVVEPLQDGRHRVVAGGRRLRALEQLVGSGEIPADQAISCCVVDDQAASEASLAENAIREAMHPADEFDAYRALVDQGSTVDQVAVRFGVTVLHVEQRLKLSNVAPELIAAYRAAEMTLAQLMTFTISTDQDQQRKVWKAARESWAREPQRLREALTKGEIDAARDPRALFVGLNAYEFAGGVVRRDLFGGATAGFITDAKLLNRLAQEKLEAVAEKVRAEGWSDVVVHVVLPWNFADNLAHEQPSYVKAKPEDVQEEKRLDSEIGKVRAKFERTTDEDEAAELEQRMHAMIEQREAIQAKRSKYSDDVIRRGTAFVGLDQHSGKLRIERGYVRRGTTRADAKVKQQRTKERAATKNDDPTATSEALTRRLTAQRTAAMRIELARNPRAAKIALSHALLQDLDSLSAAFGESVVQIHADTKAPELRHPPFEQSRAAVALAAEIKQLKVPSSGPGKKDALWIWLLEKTDDQLDRLVALGVAHCLDAVHGNDGDGGHGRLLAELLQLDMTAWWSPTRPAILDAMPKSAIVSALRETGVPAEQIANAEKAKSGELREFAEAELVKRKWLPKILRTPAAAKAAAAAPAIAPKKAASATKPKSKAKTAVTKARKGK